jgi:predicted Zn-dependent protease
MMIPLVIIFIMLSWPAENSRLLTDDKLAVIAEGQKLMLGGQWKEAFDCLSRLHEKDSTDPGGYLFRAAVMQSEMTDREENLYGRAFLILCDSARESAERYLINCSAIDSAVCYLYLGHQYAYRSIREARFGSGLSAINYGFKARREYEKGLALDSAFYDLYLGLGTFHYWKSARAGILRIAGIFRDEREKGIDELKLAADSSLFSREAARSAMIWIELNEKQYDSAVAIANEMYTKYPNGLSFLWPLAEGYYRGENYRKAQDTYYELYEKLKKTPGNYYNLIESIYWLKKTDKKLDNNKTSPAAIEYLQRVFNDIPKETRRRQRGKLSYLLGRTYR